MDAYLPLVVMVILGILFAAGSFLVSTWAAPSKPTSAKAAPYECGIVPETEPADRFPVRFYLVAMIFIVLDIEIIFLYPFAVVLGDLGAFGLIEMGLFVLAVVVAFGYVLSSGALEWGPVRIAERFAAPVLRAQGMPRPAAASSSGDGGDEPSGHPGGGQATPQPGRAA
jgi:NADH-quinone oxidoreductase subunit A